MTDDARPIDLIGYEALYLDAMRGMIRKVLQSAASPQGLPGQHHFYVTFATKAPGVTGPPDVLARFPDEMTIVLQHQFWDLALGESEFSVTLTFSGQPKRFTVPYSAITVFQDPAIRFELRLTPNLTPTDGASKQADVAEGGGSTVVALDAFRKPR
jgi:hypothetical protein